jgi:hypothetical protein
MWASAVRFWIPASAGRAARCSTVRGRLGDGGERPGSLLLSWLPGFLRPDERLRNHFVRARADLPATYWLAPTVSYSSGRWWCRRSWGSWGSWGFWGSCRSNDFPYSGAAGLGRARWLNPPGPERPGAAGPHGTPLTTCREGRHPQCQPSGANPAGPTQRGQPSGANPAGPTQRGQPSGANPAGRPGGRYRQGVSGSDDPLSALY